MMTAFDAPEMVAEALALGAYAVLGKPFELDRLVLIGGTSYAGTKRRESRDLQ